MALYVKSALNGIAAEADRVRNAAENVMETAIPAFAGELTFDATPNATHEIDSLNLVPDPQLLGDSTDWTVTNGTREVRESGLPPGFRRTAVAVADGSGQVALKVEFDAVGRSGTPNTHFWYALVYTEWTGVVQVRVRQGFGSATILTTVELKEGSARGWRLVRGETPIDVASGTLHRVELVSSGSTPAAGTRFCMTGVTVTPQSSPIHVEKNYADPGAPFTGDTAASRSYSYSWSAARNYSASRRHVARKDVFSLREAEREFTIDPANMTIAQRRAYLLSRLEAHKHPHGSTFIDLIVKLIASDVPNFTKDSITVAENIENYSINVNIQYAATGVLATRIWQLIEDVKPAHIALESVTYGGFLADVNTAGGAL